VLALLIGLSSPAGRAVAQESEADADAETTSPEEEEALDLFMEAERAYEAGRVTEAIDLLQRARALHQAPVLLFNLARAYETDGRLEDALDAYRRYLEEEPNAPDRGAIETRIHAIEGQLVERERLAEERRHAEERAAEQREEASAPSPLPWVIAGVGVLTVGAGVTFGLLADKARDDAIADPIHADALATFARGEDFAVAANVLFAVGGAIAAVGVIWGVIDLASSGSGDEQPSAWLELGPSSLRVRGRS
jgi:tetratricopeptide (TPR) repeat protein